MAYGFVNTDGDYLERDMSVDEVMDLPVSGDGRSYVTIDGRRYYRVNAPPGSAGMYIDASLAEKCRGYPMVSKAAMQWSGEGIAGVSHTDKGEVVFNSHRAKLEYAKAHGYTRDY